MKIILKQQGEKATPLKISRIWSQHTSVRARWAKVVKEFDRAERFGTLLRRWLSAEKSTWPAVKMFCGAATWNTSLWWDWLTKGARQKSGIAARKLYLQWKDPTQKTRNTGDQMNVLAKRLKHCEPLISRHRQLTEANYHIKKKKKKQNQCLIWSTIYRKTFFCSFPAIMSLIRRNEFKPVTQKETYFPVFCSHERTLVVQFWACFQNKRNGQCQNAGPMPLLAREMHIQHFVAHEFHIRSVRKAASIHSAC